MNKKSEKAKKVVFLACLAIFLFCLLGFGELLVLAAPTLNLYSKMGSAAEITSPETGPGGTVGGTPTYVEGKDGNGVLLDADTEYIDFPTVGTIDTDGDSKLDAEKMVSFWFKPSRDIDAGAGYLFDTTNKFARIQLGYTVTSTIKVYFRYNGGSFTLESGVQSWLAGEWQHFRLWWDGTDATDNVKLWLNGDSILPVHNGTFSFTYTANTFRIGLNSALPGSECSGQGVFEDIRVFETLDGTPAIDSLSDDTLIPGQQIIISGSNFGINDDEEGEINFGGISGTIDSWTDTSLTVTVPSGISDGQVTVTTYIGTSNGANYTLAPNIEAAYYASTRDILLIKGGAFGANQGPSKAYADGVDLGIADWWDTNRIYYQNISSKPSSVRVEAGGEELTSSVTNLSLYSPYPYDSDTSSADLVSYWPFDSNWEDVKGNNDGTNLGTALRPSSIFGKALQPSQLIAFDDNRYVAFGSLLKLNNGDIIDVYRNAEGHFVGDGRVQIKRSTDGGYNWSEPTTIISEEGYDYGTDSIIQLANGDILAICRKRRLVPVEEEQIVIFGSTDNGYSWSQRDVIDGAELGPMESIGQPFGLPIQLANGRIIFPCGGKYTDHTKDQRTKVTFYSDNNGYTWNFLGIITYLYLPEDRPTTTTIQAYSAGATEITVNDASIFPEQGLVYITDGVDEEHFSYGSKDGNTLKNIYDNSLYVESGINNDYDSGATVKWWISKISEVQIIKAPDDNNLLALIRHDGFGTAPINRILYSRSTDGGATWSGGSGLPGLLHFSPTDEPVIGQGFRAYLSQENRLYLVYRWNGTKLAYSDDNGATWTGDNTSTPLDASNYYINNNAGAYASFVEFDDRIMIQSYREYNGKYGDAYIEKAYIYKDNPANVGNYVRVPASSTLQLNRFSVEFWIRSDTHYKNSSFGASQIIVSKRDASEDSFNNCNYIFKLLDPTGADADKVEFGLYDSTHSYQSVKSDSALETGQWYHVAGTYNGSTMRLYVDGMLQDNLDTDLTTLESSPLTVGIYSVNRDWYTNYKKFQGQIDNLKIWNTALTENKILFNANYDSPTISSVSPNQADRGTTQTIQGTNFGASQNDSTITIGGTAMTAGSWSDSQIQAPIPAGISKGAKQIIVTVNGHNSNGYSVTVGKAPAITNLQVSEISQTSAKTSWTTDELADSSASWGASPMNLEYSDSSGTQTTQHQLTLTALNPGTTYYFAVSSTDADGNTGSSSISSFATGQEGSSTSAGELDQYLESAPQGLYQYLQAESALRAQRAKLQEQEDINKEELDSESKTLEQERGGRKSYRYIWYLSPVALILILLLAYVRRSKW